ncbi:hypothetical protein LXL04_005147 [Taraxacum kok-saghyz]
MLINLIKLCLILIRAFKDVVPIVAVFSAGPVGVFSFSNCCLKQLIRINNPSIVMNVALIIWRNNETVCNQGQLWNKVEDDVVSNRLVYWRWVLKWRFHVISLRQQIVVDPNELLKTAIAKAGYTGKVVIGMDVAASEFYAENGKTYNLNFKEVLIRYVDQLFIHAHQCMTSRKRSNDDDDDDFVYGDKGFRAIFDVFALGDFSFCWVQGSLWWVPAAVWMHF